MGHYEVLGVAPDAPTGEIRRAYVTLARRHHPDSGGSTERMQALNEAWAVLGDAAARRRYDLTLAPRRQPAPPRPGWAGPPGSDGPGARPLADDLLQDLLDDRPIHGGMVRLPPWLAMVPPGAAAAGVLALLLGLLLRLAPVLALGAMLLLLSALLFVLSPFVALAASQRRGNG